SAVEPAVPPERDPEFRGQVEPRLLEIDYAPEAYLRLVANPFLALFALIAWVGLAALAFRRGFDGTNSVFIPAFVIVMVVLLLRIPVLLQSHCLDCGATGRLAHWRRHACPAAAARRRSGRPRPLRGPTPPTQVILWLWLLLTVGIVV